MGREALGLPVIDSGPHFLIMPSSNSHTQGRNIHPPGHPEGLVSEDHLQESSDVGGHPKGTLAIVGIYGLLFALGWLILYFGVFLPRGPLTQ